MPRRRKPDNSDDAARLARNFLRLPRPAQVVIVIIALVISALLLFNYSRQQRRQPQQQGGPVPQSPTATTPPAEPSTASQREQAAAEISTGDVNHLLGNPSRATPDPANSSNFLMVKPFYTLSYNAAKGIPNWVSWRVTRADLGSAPRRQLFATDTTLPPGFYRVTHRDYTGSGFDRGHVCPHSDRAASRDMSFATFVMTNIIPQAPVVNEQTWADLEEYCRRLVNDDRAPARLYIIAGPAGQGGRGADGDARAIAHGKVVVPAACWKIIVALPANLPPADDLRNITPAARVIAVLMPNDNAAIGPDWTAYRTTPAAIERQTGYHFFDRLPPAVADALRQKLDTVPVP